MTSQLRKRDVDVGTTVASPICCRTPHPEGSLLCSLGVVLDGYDDYGSILVNLEVSSHGTGLYSHPMNSEPRKAMWFITHLFERLLFAISAISQVLSVQTGQIPPACPYGQQCPPQLFSHPLFTSMLVSCGLEGCRNSSPTLFLSFLSSPRSSL